MRLTDLSQLCDLRFARPDDSATADVSITGLVCDSRCVVSGNVFFVLSGSVHDGSEFVRSAITNGAIAIVCTPDSPANAIDDIIIFHSSDPRRSFSFGLCSFYGLPPLFMAAITGTSGKTSVSSFLHQIWCHHDIPSAMIGTTGIHGEGYESSVSGLTTPDPTQLYSTLSRMNSDGITHCVLEASSHGLDQKRLDAIEFSVCAFTNFGRDHLDYHVDMEHYLISKLRLFVSLLSSSGTAILFSDDPHTDRFIEACRSRHIDTRTIGYDGDFIKLLNVESDLTGHVANILYEGCEYELTVSLLGDFQLTNVLLSAGMAISLGLSASSVFSCLGRLRGVSGRLENIGVKDGCPCFVDYAHKPDALEHILTTLRPLITGRLVLVFGCGGDRDRGKRPLMGEIAHRLSDIVIITDDNPRTEDPAFIRFEILRACPDAVEISDRREAIRYGFDNLESGDCLIVAGKGHESGQTIGTETFPFSDRDELLNLLEGEKN